MSIAADLRPAIRKLVSRSDLTETEIENAFQSIFSGRADDAAIGGFLVALSMKGETAPEVRSMVRVTKEYANRITPQVSGRLIDTCGTGGDSIRSFNISTASAVVACAAGAKVAKHGNRSVSGVCGSADFLEHIGLSLDTPPEKVKECIEKTGIGFLFAPVFHPAMKNAAGARKAIGVRTIFNMIGPLSNPCTNISGQVIGVFEPMVMELLADAFYGYLDDAMIVHAVDGFDEFSNTCDNYVLRIRGKNPPQRLRVHPRALNMAVARPESLTVSSKEDSIRATMQTIYGKAQSEKEDIVVLNASAALVVAHIAADLKEGVVLARAAIQTGKAREKLSELISYCGDVDRLRDAERKFL